MRSRDSKADKRLARQKRVRAKVQHQDFVYIRA